MKEHQKSAGCRMCLVYVQRTMLLEWLAWQWHTSVICGSLHWGVLGMLPLHVRSLHARYRPVASLTWLPIAITCMCTEKTAEMVAIFNTCLSMDPALTHDKLHMHCSPPKPLCPPSHWPEASAAASKSAAHCGSLLNPASCRRRFRGRCSSAAITRLLSSMFLSHSLFQAALGLSITSGWQW